MENGFQVWSFQGKLLYRVTRDRFFQVSSQRSEQEAGDALKGPNSASSNFVLGI
jgi:hypothetical protein